MDEAKPLTDPPTRPPSDPQPRHDGRGWDRENRRRVAVLYVDEQQVFDALLFTYLDPPRNPSHRLRLSIDGLPLDCAVVSVKHDWPRRAFGFLLFHESFAPVPEGCPAPDLTVNLRWEWAPVAPDPDPVPLVFEPK